MCVSTDDFRRLEFSGLRLQQQLTTQPQPLSPTAAISRPSWLPIPPNKVRQPVFSTFSVKRGPFAAIIIAHGTHIRRQEFVLGAFEAEGREREGVLEEEQRALSPPARGSGKLPSGFRAEPLPQMQFLTH